MPCPLCRADPVEDLFVKDEVPYHCCPSCEFVFSRGATNPNLVNAIEDYEPAYLQYLGDSVEDERNHAAFLTWVERFARMRGRTVLDVGAGNGKLVRFLRGKGVDAYGIEPAAPLFARFLAHERCFFEKTVDEFAEMAHEESFSVVLACDVIEHVERPDSFLEKIATLLEPGGTLIVSTPDVASAFARICGRRWHYYNRYHLSYLSRTTLARIAAESRLEEVGFARLSRSKSLGYLLQYLADFGLGGSRFRVSERWNRLTVPINLFDTMYAVFEKRGPRSGD